MTEFSDLWDKLRQQLATDYRDEDDIFAAQCFDIASKIAHTLLIEGKDPVIYSVRGNEVNKDGWIGNETLVPVPYEGRVRWGAHFVCVESGIAYDPILETPEPIETYGQRAFNQEVRLTPRSPRPPITSPEQ